MTAMGNATENAGEIIDGLTLKMNRLDRQQLPMKFWILLVAPKLSIKEESREWRM
jgi:hypothetical protein